MCGIFALFGKWASDAAWRAQSAKMKHRGPDGTKERSYDDIFIAHHRLALNDCSAAGDQPFEIDGAMVIVNGEIYNYQELVQKHSLQDALKSKSDCEVVIHLYKKIGFEAAIRELRGVFAIILVDRDTGITWAARDPIGVRPLLVASTEDSLALASEARCLSQASTLVRPFPPASIMKYDMTAHTIHTAPYWHLPRVPTLITERETATTAVARRLRRPSTSA